MLRPTAVKVFPLDNSKVRIIFDNKEVKIFDVTPYIKGSFYGHLANKEYFDKVYTNGFSIEWPEGQDLCPDEIYYSSIPA